MDAVAERAAQVLRESLGELARRLGGHATATPHGAAFTLGRHRLVLAVSTPVLAATLRRQGLLRCRAAGPARWTCALDGVVLAVGLEDPHRRPLAAGQMTVRWRPRRDARLRWVTPPPPSYGRPFDAALVRITHQLPAPPAFTVETPDDPAATGDEGAAFVPVHERLPTR